MKYNGIHRKIVRFAGSKLGLRECFVTVADNRAGALFQRNIITEWKRRLSGEWVEVSATWTVDIDR